MSPQFRSGNTEFEFRTATAPAMEEYREEPPFCMAILGDFSGRGNRGLREVGAALAGRGRMGLDVDNFDKLPGKLGAVLHIPVGGGEGPTVEIRFSDLEDFHPDRIYDRLEIFQRLKSLRGRLQAPATFAEAAAEVRSWTADSTETEVPQAAPVEESPAAGKESDGDMLERLLGKKPTAKQSPAETRRKTNIDSLIREMVKPYIVPSPDPQQGELISQVDQAISGQMRLIVQHPDFRELEAGWRMLQMVVSRVETDETLKLYIMDITKGELAGDLVGAESWQATGMYRLIVEQSIGIPGADPWGLLVGAYTFDQSEEDVILLRQLAKIGQAAGAPFLAGADSHFAGCESVAATPDPDDWRRRGEAEVIGKWEELRGAPEAAYLGLALPRVMLRLPYGEGTEAIERFVFEELTEPGDHEGHLWGNSAVVCACLLAEAFVESGWDMMGVLGGDMTEVPMHVFEQEGEKHVIPGAETFLTERAMEILIKKGLMPVLSFKGRDAVKIARFQSVAEPAAALGGRWR